VNDPKLNSPHPARRRESDQESLRIASVAPPGVSFHGVMV